MCTTKKATFYLCAISCIVVSYAFQASDAAGDPASESNSGDLHDSLEQLNEDGDDAQHMSRRKRQYPRRYWGNGGYGIRKIQPYQFEISKATEIVSWTERVVTDLNTIKSPRGVPIDFRYNETRRRTDDGFNSAAGCPKSIDGYPWVYYGNPPCCHLAGQKGPCGDDQLLYLIPGSLYGFCGCNCFMHKVDGETFESSPDGRYTFCWDDVQDNRVKACYKLGTQGPCGRNQMLIKDKSGLSVECGKQCPPSTRYPFYPLKYHPQIGMCGGFGGGGGGAGLSWIDRYGNCPDGETYSEILKKCILKRRTWITGGLPRRNSYPNRN